MYFKDTTSAIGHTPLVEMTQISPNNKVKILAKLEGQNLGGSASIKDRVAIYMLEKAEQSGVLTKDKIIIEATSGNTGIALAWLGQMKGYRVAIVMPDNMSLERQQLINVYDAAYVDWEVGKKKPKTHQKHSTTGAGAGWGAFWGLLFGLIFFMPILGVAIGAGLGALFGSLNDVGIDDDFINSVKSQVTEGTSALFLLTGEATEGKVVDAMKQYDFEVISTNLSDEDEAKLRAAFAEEE